MPADTTTLSIVFRPDLNLLIVRWLRDVSKTELREGYAEARQVAVQHQAYGWLIDSRRRSESDAEMVDWLANDYLPGLSPALNQQLVRLGCLVAATWQPSSAPVTPLAVLAHANSPTTAQGYQVRLFGDEGTAMRWLQQG